NLTYRDDEGRRHRTHHLTDYTGCGFNDPDHSYTGGRVQLNGGRCDGFRRGRNDDYALGYYTRDDLPLTRQLVDEFMVCDHWFASILGPTYPNRFYTHSAATDRIRNTFDVCALPTIWDRLIEAGIPSAYYFSDLPFLALYGGKYQGLSKRVDEFFADAAGGRLPSYSYVDPGFLGDTQNDDHPHADIRRGQNFVGRVVDAVVRSPQWSSTLLIITYDEWGGFFDTVAPPRFPDLVSNPGGDVTNPDHGQAGFRVPTFLVSPFTRRKRLTRTVFEHSAIPKLVEWRFGLSPLTPRDAASNNIAGVLDFRHPRAKPPTIVVPPDPGPQPCGPELTATTAGVAAAATTSDEATWEELAATPLMRGWGVS
ncbi:MAG TPA: alkaline phosphatase family protein, partial [Acidimicrobiales bacterium]|nr:alkaline phosphatase family protein [Acidimicrobiales bacterium]